LRPVFALAISTAAHAEPAPCPGNPDVLGTARVLTVDATTTRLGRKHVPRTLPLAPKEVVLTFDDGPEPATTARLLDTPKRECVRASFFSMSAAQELQQVLARLEAPHGGIVPFHDRRQGANRRHAAGAPARARESRLSGGALVPTPRQASTVSER
jgi:hypothetical protein